MIRSSSHSMAVICLTVFIDVIGFGIIIPLLPFYAEAFGASPAIITLLFSCYSLMQFLFAPFWGTLCDRIGRRPVLLLSIGGSCISYLWCGLASSLWMLFAARLLAGFMGGTIVTAQAYMSDLTTPNNRAKGMGMIGAALGLGFMLGPAIGGGLAGINTESVNYQLPLLAASGISLCGFVFAIFALPKGRSNQQETISVTSSTLQKNCKALKSPLIRVLIGVFFLIHLGLLGAQTTLALWLERQFSWGPQETGYTLMFCAIWAIVIQGGMMGVLSHKFGEVNLLISGITLLGVGLFLVPFSTTLVQLLGAVSFLTIGECLAKTTMRSLLSQLAKANETGKILGIAQSASSLGTIAGPALAGVMFMSIGKDAPFFNAVLLTLIAGMLCLCIIKSIRLNLKAQRPEMVI